MIANGKTTCVHEILRELSQNDENFPIADLAEIIIEYVYELPEKCIQTTVPKNIPLCLTQLRDGRIACGTNHAELVLYNGIELAIIPSVGTGNFTSLIELKDGCIICAEDQAIIKTFDQKSKKYLGNIDCSFVGTFVEVKECLVGVSNDCEIIEYNRNTAQLRKFKENDFNDINIIIKLRDNTIAAGLFNGFVVIYEDAISTSFQINKGIITALVETTDGNIICCTHEGYLVKCNRQTKDFIIIKDSLPEFDQIIVLKNDYLAVIRSIYPDIFVLDPKTGNTINILYAHSEHINSIIELQNGCIASCSADGTIKIWG